VPRDNEPLGIRKVDYQQQRRDWRRTDSRQEKQHLIKLFEDLRDRQGHRQLTESEAAEWVIGIALEYGWEQGVKVGVEQTKARVQESLANGKLIKAKARA